MVVSAFANYNTSARTQARALTCSMFSEALYWCAREGQHGCLRVLLENGATPSYQTSNMCSPAGMAAEKDAVRVTTNAWRVCSISVSTTTRKAR